MPIIIPKPVSNAEVEIRELVDIAFNTSTNNAKVSTKMQGTNSHQPCCLVSTKYARYRNWKVAATANCADGFEINLRERRHHTRFLKNRALLKNFFHIGVWPELLVASELAVLVTSK